MITVLLTTLAFAVDITVGGTCPGVQEWTISDLPDDGLVFIIAGAGPGGEAGIPFGACEGTNTGLMDPILPLTPARDTDGDGVIAFAPDVPADVCSMAIVAADLSCGVSLPVPIGGDSCEVVCARAAAAGCGIADDCVSDCDTDMDICPDDMGAVLECHATHAIHCDPAEDQDIGKRGCVDQHREAEACGIDPF
jgi:hypothetical protein